jgi:hypothetical protein
MIFRRPPFFFPEREPKIQEQEQGCRSRKDWELLLPPAPAPCSCTLFLLLHPVPDLLWTTPKRPLTLRILLISYLFRRRLQLYGYSSNTDSARYGYRFRRPAVQSA